MTFAVRTLGYLKALLSYSGTMTESVFTVSTNNYTGFGSGLISGSSMSPSTLPGGIIFIYAIYDSRVSGVYTSSTFTLSGFSVDPLASYATSVKCGSVTLLTSSASYSYSGGYATWTFPSGSNPGWNLAGTGTTSVIIS